MFDKKASTKKSFFGEAKEISILLLVIFLIRTFGFGLYQVPTGSMETTMLCGERFFADKFTPLFLKFKHLDIVSINEPTFKYSDNRLKKIWQKYVWGPSNWTKRIIGLPGDTIKGVVEDGKPVVYRNGKRLEESYVNKYPLIGVWNMDSEKGYKLVHRELGEAVCLGNEALLQQIASQSFYKYCSMRSYNPDVPYSKQLFYKMSKNSVFKGFGDIADSKPFFVFPDDTAPVPGQSLTKRGNSCWGSGSDDFYVELGKDEYWLMGDNRRNSHDARFFGPVKAENIRGKIVFRIFSVMPAEYEAYFSQDGSLLERTLIWLKTSFIGELIFHPISYWSRVRWSRCLERVN